MKTIADTIGQFFKKHRVAANIQPEQVVEYLSLSSIEQLLDYESGKQSIPLEDVFSLTNLYNIPPDQVVVLFYNLSHQSAAELNSTAPTATTAPLNAKSS